jgi:hypothetical protein
MQLRSLIFTTALAVAVTFAPTVNAAECTDAQLKEMDTLENDPTMDKACPDPSGSGSFDFEQSDPKAWAKISPCANPTCVTYLTSQLAKMPDCEVDMVSMKTVYQDKLALCVDLASGKLTPVEIEIRIGNLTTVLFGLEDWSNSGSDDDSSDSGSDSGSSDYDAGEPDGTVRSVSTGKSGAATVAVTGGAVFVAAALAALY